MPVTTAPTAHQGPLTIALVDDHDLSVAGLECLLTPYAGRVELLDLRSAVGRAKDVDVVLYEPVGQSAFGDAMLRDLQRAGDALAVVWSWAPLEDLPTATARPYLSKQLTASQLVVTLEELISGRGAHVPTTRTEDEATAAAELAAAPEVTDEPRPMRTATPVHAHTPTGMRLTRREHEILVLITNGLTNAEIGEQLTLSINSIKTYIRQAYRKIDVERRAQAVAWGMTNGLGATLPEDLGHDLDAADDGDEVRAEIGAEIGADTTASAGGATLSMVAARAS